MNGMKLIAGSGRSGTTWVLDVLASANDLRPIFEPLHPAVSEIGARYAYRLLLPEEQHPELRDFLCEVSTGWRYKMWTRYRGRPDLLFPPLRQLTKLADTKRVYHRWRKFLRDAPELARAGRPNGALIKCIRANLMLGWLSRWCNSTTVLLVRHPGAVVESQYRSGVWDPEIALNRYRSESRLHGLTGNRYRSLLDRPLSQLEALALNWVIENQWPMERAVADGVVVVYYEDLHSRPDLEWPRLCRALGLRNLPDAMTLERPSQQSAADRSTAPVDGAVEPRWMRALTPDQIGRVQAVLDETGAAVYSMCEPFPRRIAGLDARSNAVMAGG